MHGSLSTFSEAVLARVDPRLRESLRAQLRSRVDHGAPVPERLVLVGHRAAGKTTLLPLIAERLGRKAIDLDTALEARGGRPLRDWLLADAPGFRRAEREVFLEQDPRAVIAAGGGFLSLHSDLLTDRTAVLIPVSFETYCERLSADRTRPRLRPELSLEDELRAVFFEREEAHARVSTTPLVELLAAIEGTRL